MEEEQTKEQPQEVKPLSIVEEAARIRDEIKAEREKLEAERTKMEELRSEQILSGTGGEVKQEVPKEETAKEYAARVMSGVMNNGE